MDIDEDMNEDINLVEDIDSDDELGIDSDDELDIEDALTHLKDFSNEKQLYILKREIGHIMVHRITPSDGWYDERYKHIILYSNLEWSQLAKKFHKKDDYLHNTALYIMRLADELIEDRAAKPNLNLTTYYNLIMSVYNVWNYYKQLYCSDDDMDMMDLVEGMSFLMK